MKLYKLTRLNDPMHSGAVVRGDSPKEARERAADFWGKTYLDESLSNCEELTEVFPPFLVAISQYPTFIKYAEVITPMLFGCVALYFAAYIECAIVIHGLFHHDWIEVIFGVSFMVIPCLISFAAFVDTVEAIKRWWK
jgi:hypothetical protein